MELRIIWAPALSALSAGGEGERQPLAIGVDCDVPRAMDHLLGAIAAPIDLRDRRRGGLAVEDRRARLGFAPGAFAIEHHRAVGEGRKPHQLDDTAEPPVDGLSRWNILWQHLPSPRAGHIADRSQHLLPINLSPAASPSLGRLRQAGLDQPLFLAQQITRIALRLPLNGRHPGTRLPHPHAHSQ